MHFQRPRLSYANVIATLALFVALGGAAVAAGLPKNSVGTKQLKRGAVTASDIRREAVASGKIGNGAVSGDKLGDEAVSATKLGYEAVGTPKLGYGAVTTPKLGDGAVTSSKLADGSVTLSKLAAGVPPPPSLLLGEQTERGTFLLGGNTTLDRDAISYPIPLWQEAGGEVLGLGEHTAGCPGRKFIDGKITVEAAPGHLCVYIAFENGKNPSLDLKFTTNLGAGLEASFSEADPDNTIFGFWTVTAL